VSEPTSTTASVKAPETVAYSLVDLVRHALRLGTLGFERFPAAIARLDVVANVEFTPEELGSRFAVHLDAVEANGEVLAETMEGDSTLLLATWPEEFNDFPPSRVIIGHFSRLGFPAPGKYFFRIVRDGQEVRRLPLLIWQYESRASDSPPSSGQPAEQPQPGGTSWLSRHKICHPW
jgi:hypothetical protein